MPVSDDMRRSLYRRSGGQCECTLAGCKDHQPRRRCSNFLYSDAWKAVRLRKKGPDNLRNLRACCPNCAKNIQP